MTDREPCPISRTLNVLGDRWSVLILRDLLLRGPHRFQDLKDSLTGIGPTTLSARLKALEAKGLVERSFYSDHPPRAEYLLTEKGRSLGPLFAQLRDWGRAHT
ncbi:MAG: winged helix-turn-helix transcriptional regulator [Parvularculaceae bacterium]